MPNGGSDCCGTCRFNRANIGRMDHGMPRIDDVAAYREESYCEIRELQIENPFYTYCANSTVRQRHEVTVPLGPVYVHEWIHVKNADGVECPVSSRRVWVEAPDTEDVRTRLLACLVDPSLLGDSYPWEGKGLLHEVIDELVRLGEMRAIPILEEKANDLRREGKEPVGAMDVIERIRNAAAAD